jgi:hypothetical protein
MRHSRVSPVVGLLPSSPGQACFEMAFPPFFMKQLSLPCLWELGMPQEGEDDCWVGEAIILCITPHYTPPENLNSQVWSNQTNACAEYVPALVVFCSKITLPEVLCGNVNCHDARCRQLTKFLHFLTF